MKHQSRTEDRYSPQVDLPFVLQLEHVISEWCEYPSMQVYILGGVGDKQYYSDIWVLDVITSSWDQLDLCSRKSQGQFSHTATVTNMGIAIFGGWDFDTRSILEYFSSSMSFTDALLLTFQVRRGRTSSQRAAHLTDWFAHMQSFRKYGTLHKSAQFMNFSCLIIRWFVSTFAENDNTYRRWWRFNITGCWRARVRSEAVLLLQFRLVLKTFSCAHYNHLIQKWKWATVLVFVSWRYVAS